MGARPSRGAFFLATMSLGYVVYAADRVILSSMLSPMQVALGLSSLQVGLLGSAQYVGVLAFVFLSGALSDRYGAKRVIIVGVSVFTAFTWTIGLAQDFYQAFFFRLVSGFGEGLFWPAAMAALAGRFRERKGLALGVFYIGFDAGSVFGLGAGGAVLSLTSNWRAGFFLTPLLGVAVLAGLFLTDRGTGQPASESKAIPWRDMFGLAKRREVLVICLFAFLATWATVWQVVFLPYYNHRVLGMSDASASFAAALVLAAGGAGKFVLGGASDRVNRSLLLAGTSAAVVAAYLAFFSTFDVAAALASGAAMGFASAAVFPVLQALMADTSNGMTGAALGLTTTSQSLAAVFSTTIAGYLSGETQAEVRVAVILTAMVPAVLMTVVALGLREPRRSASKG